MSAKYICDGCGKETPGEHHDFGKSGWQPPKGWLQRQTLEGILDACSKPCIETIVANPNEKVAAILKNGWIGK